MLNGGYPGYTLERFHGKCPCGTMTDENLGYSEYYDTFFCKVCRNWLSPPCGHPDCEDCRTRPEKVPIPTENSRWEIGFSYALYKAENPG